MDYRRGERRPIWRMPYRRRHDGLGAIQRREEQDTWELLYILIGQISFPMLVSV